MFLRRRPARSASGKAGQASTQARGQQAESLAADHLKRQGLTLIQRNARAGRGEIDLVMREGNTLVFVEVRARRRRAMVGAAESITATKRRKVVETAERLLQQHPEWQNLACRFDVVAVEWHPANQQVAVDWIRDAFC